ncbi:MCE family protein [Pseudonocardia eucalypti]
MVAIAALLFVAYRVDALPVIGSGPEYQAEFSEAAGLATSNEVRVAGVKVGKVTGVELAGDHVLVTFRAKGVKIGDASTASIQIKTLLGDKFLSVEPAGDKELSKPIPRERTVAPYDVVQAFNQLSDTVRELDTNQLAGSLRTLSETFKDTPDEVRTSLDGLSRLSVTIASRDAQLAHLLDGTNQATHLLANRNEDINRILSDGAKLLDELHNRERAIKQLLDGTRDLSRELRGLIKDNEKQIGPTLDRLDRLTRTLEKHLDELTTGTRKLAPFASIFGNAIGNGHWVDNYIDGFVPDAATVPNTGQLPSGPLPRLGGDK